MADVELQVAYHTQGGAGEIEACLLERGQHVASAGATICCSTDISTATTAPAWAPSHQTGWTGIVLLIEIFGRLGPQAVSTEGRASALGREIETA